MSTIATVDSSANQRSRPRAADDFYVEEPWMVRGLFDNYKLYGGIWDPACGTGTIVKIARERGMLAIGSDKVYRGFPVDQSEFRPFDFMGRGLRARKPRWVKNIVCNPPFYLAADFVRRALPLVSGDVCILQRLAFIESKGRADIFNNGHFAALLPFARRGNMPPGGLDVPRKGGAVAFAWFIWSGRGVQNAIVKRIEDARR